MGATGATGILIGGDVERFPLAGTNLTLDKAEYRQGKEFEQNDLIKSLSDGGTKEYGVLLDADGVPYMAYKGEEHSVHIGDEVLNSGGTFTHYHPDKDFGGTLSIQDLKVFAKSNLKELRAFSKQGQMYSVKAGPNADREGLLRWAKMSGKLQQQNLNKSYAAALKAATTPLKSGPNKGKIKIKNPRTGKTVYREPMTDKQAQAFARQWSVGSYDRMYKKNLEKYGFTYTATKAGKKLQ